VPLLPAFCAVAAADVALADRGRRRVRWFTKPLLMPLLAAHVARVGGSDETRPLVLAGLGLSGLGDVALLAAGDAPFTAGLTSFLGAHGCYLAALAKRRQGSARRLWWIAAAYVLAWAGLNLVLFPRTGRLRFPVLVYGTVLVAMAFAALDTGEPVVAVGGAAFLASDAILALDTFGAYRAPHADGVVMLTYTAAQALIAGGLVRPAAPPASS
jgi:uncharacterized membrane protein YhhN